MNDSRAATPDGRTAGAVPTWHALPVDEVLDLLDTDGEDGLAAAEATRRLEEHGPNRLPEERPESTFRRLLKQFHNVLIYILIAAAGFTAFLGEWIDTGVIIAVVLVNALIGFVQEGKAERALDEIRRMLSLDARVVRGSRRRTVDAGDLVPGDIVLLDGGDRVPADLRVIKARDVRVEEAALTGESQPVSKAPAGADADALLGDRTSMVYSGTMITAGHLRGVVVATGEATELGRIGEMVARVERMDTPLLRKIDRFGRVLSAAIVVLGALLFFLGWLLRGFQVGEMFLVVVSFAVAAIPEGLPAILTITLALGVRRMSRRNAIIRRLPAVETLGSVTTICSDKTGTLTRSELMVGRVLLDGRSLHVTGSGYEPGGEVRDGDTPMSDQPEELTELVRAAVLCNDAELDDDDADVRIVGDPTDAALLVLARKAGHDPAAVRSSHERLDAIPFESANRFMATLHADESGDIWIQVKGAPESILEACTAVSSSDAGESAVDDDEWARRIDAVADEGYRMLALAVRRGENGQSRIDADDVRDLTLLGAVGLMDPPREEAVEAVARCQGAGIRVVMITGDHALTARSIGARLGIGDGTSALTGRDVEDADDEALGEMVADNDVIARASPEHKLRLVRALQAAGEVVAMTGDGVNDAPALKQADIGIAMGIKGTEAAKGASEMVLADDNFASIEYAVEQGRTVYDNLRKTILFILPTNGAEALMVVAAVAFALPAMPITPVQILWVNMVTAVTLALALAFEPTEPNIMERPPRPPGEPILYGHLLGRIGYVSALVAAACLALFLLEIRAGVDVERARTVAVNALVTAEAFYLFNCRFIWRSSMGLRSIRGNRAVLVAVGSLVALQIAFTYVPVVQTWFGTAPISASDWLWCLVLGATVFSIVEAEKAVGRRRLRRARSRRRPLSDGSSGGLS
ncbi:MAG TPA: HAD-IC family P-type ATPase [Longimicrobiales bacterium]|nr:HAD-IC family P-type ATPase [Longimicrobiales bacterium]